MTKDTNIISEDTDSSFVEIPDVDFENIKSDKFDNISLLYTSGSGIIQLLSATRYGKRFILKCLTEANRNDPVWKLALRKEFEIGITLDHPNIRRTIGFENIPEVGYAIVLEYIDGETLEQALEEGRVSKNNAQAIVCQLADAIQYLHKRQIVHRDIKPANILVTFSGNNVKLIDLSLADDDSFLIIKNPAGTQKYMAPEQMNPDAKASQSADIYSFGMTIKEIASLTDDKKIMKLAEKCCEANPLLRPNSMSEIRLTLSESQSRNINFLSLDSKLLTIILCLIVTVLLIIIAFKIYIIYF